MSGRLLTIVVGLSVMLGACSKDTSSPTSTSPPPSGPSLTANPPSATVGVGTSQDVSVSGGTPPYVIASAPAAIVTAQLLNGDSLVATLHITGVSVASGGTSVTVRDNSTSQTKSVTVPIAVR